MSEAAQSRASESSTARVLVGCPIVSSHRFPQVQLRYSFLMVSEEQVSLWEKVELEGTQLGGKAGPHQH